MFNVISRFHVTRWLTSQISEKTTTTTTTTTTENTENPSIKTYLLKQGFGLG